jgi:DNA-binding NarL/FixJ family response regulator
VATRGGEYDAGWEALAQGRWRDARALFEDALAVRAAPRALEGLSWAAWWLDDAATVFEARASAYRLYREAGDAASAARMAAWLAADQLDFHGAAAVAAGWLRRAHRLLDPLPPGPDHGWLAFHEGYLAHATGNSAPARLAGLAAADIGRRFDVPDLEMLGLALEGAVLVAAAEVDEGMRRLDEATATALEGRASIPISSAWTCCFLVGACTAVRDHARAFAWCDRIAEFAERFGSRYMLAFCRSEYGVVELWRGRWQDAESLLTASLEDFSQSRPAWIGAPLVELAELRRRQGREDEARELLDRAGTSTAAHLCRARLALDAGEAARASELAGRVLRRLGADRSLARAPALEIAVRARIARGDLSGAEEAVDELQEIAGLVATVALRASAEVATGLLAAARGHHDRARALLEDGIDGLAAAGAPYDVADARLELAVTLEALGEPGAATLEATAAVDALRRLGAEAAATRGRRLLRALRERTATPVTRRERDVLRLLAAGLTNRQIAERLVISEHTVHRHVTNILRKLDLPSRTAAAAYAVRSGLVDEPGAGR